MMRIPSSSGVTGGGRLSKKEIIYEICITKGYIFQQIQKSSSS